MTGIPFTQTETCMMYQKQTDKNLISVMNKSIGSVSEEEQNEVIRHYSASSLNMLKEAPVDEIKLDMRLNEEKLLISLKNTYADKPDFMNGLPYTSEAGHGFGTKSIWYVAEKLNGSCQFSVTDTYFILRVIL